MKKYLGFLLLLATFSASAQLRKVPAEVTSTFETKFPEVKKVSWKDNITNFEARFTLNDVETSAKFNKKGEWLVTEKTVEYIGLPEAVQDGFKKSKYADWEVKKVVMVDENDRELVYRILVKKNDVQKRHLFFKVDGKLLKDPITI
jgi:hypothetical protein